MGIKTETVWLLDGKVFDHQVTYSTEARRVLEDFHDQYGLIHRGFVFDGASAPAFLYPWISPFSNLELSGRHDLDCGKARDLMRIAKTCEDIGDVSGYIYWRKRALRLRKVADARYRRGTIKAKRASYSWSWRGNVVGSLAWAGVRIGSFWGTGW